MPTGGTYALHFGALLVLWMVIPKTWAAHHPSTGLAGAIHYILG
jgi:hypothetical protein